MLSTNKLVFRFIDFFRVVLGSHLGMLCSLCMYFHGLYLYVCMYISIYLDLDKLILDKLCKDKKNDYK